MPASILETPPTLESADQSYRFWQWLHDRAEEMRFKQTSGWLFLADQVEAMAQEARLFDCDGPEDFLARRDVMEDLAENKGANSWG